MNSLGYHRPTSVAEACDLLAAHGDRARLIAGGTGLGILLKERLLDLDHLVSLEAVPVADVAWHDGVLRVGAMTTHQALADHPLVRRHLPIFAEVLGQVASRRIRNVATIGGNLCWGEAATDPPGLLIALGAEVTVQSVRGTRRVPVRELFRDYFMTSLEPDEMLTTIDIPAAAGGVAYIKFTPQSKADKPVLGVTALVRRGPGGTCAEARIVVSAAGPTPISLPAVDALLAGTGRADGDAVHTVAARYAEAARPVADTRGSEAYKRRMIGVLIRRALEGAWRRAEGSR